MLKFSDIIQCSKAAEQQVTKGKVDIIKSDNEKQYAFGWANISVMANGEQVVDWHNDMIDPEELENAAYRFVEFYREGGEMHERGGTGVLIESMVFTEEKLKILGLEKGSLPIGWWVGFHITDSEVWEKVKDGTYRMFSIEGRAVRVPVDDE